MGGFVYVLTHPRIPGLVKIGYTTTTVEQRVAEINHGAGVPGGFHIYFSIASSHQTEQLIYRKLSEFRHSRNKKFFELKPEVAVDYIKSIVTGAEFGVRVDDEFMATLAEVDSAKRLGELVRHHRKIQGLRQDELAGVAGVGVRFVVDLEAGKPTIQFDKAVRVASMLGLRVGLTLR